MDQIRVNWEGAFFSHHSLAMVNRELALPLSTYPDIHLTAVETEPAHYRPSADYDSLSSSITAHASHADVTIRHRWPMDLSRADSSVNILFQPWEFGSIPQSWVEPINTNFDEIWTSSSFSKAAFVDDGIEESKVVVIPQGINPTLFRPDAAANETLKQRIGNRFAFLFIGGAIPRKGVDILVNAYLNTFTKADPVVLIIKGCTLYSDGIASQIRTLAERSDIPEIIYFTEDLPPEQLPGLYRACDCYVQPYRAEGFCLPVAEAMGCALPTVVTGAGSVLDFTTKETSLYIESQKEYFSEQSVAGIDTVQRPYWYVPYWEHLGQLMRAAVENQTALKFMGEQGAIHIRKGHTWEKGAEVIAQRIRALTATAKP